jgi:hypothetical protein
MNWKTLHSKDTHSLQVDLLIYRLNGNFVFLALLLEPCFFFLNQNKVNLKFTWEGKASSIDKTILKRKCWGKSQNLIFKAYNEVLVDKTVLLVMDRHKISGSI